MHSSLLSPMYATLPSPFLPKSIHAFSLNKTSSSLRTSAQAASFKSATATESNRAAVALAGSLYEILRVERTASLNEIKTAYRSLAKVYHPDANGSSSDGRDFIEIRNAYATLSDPTARAVYDMSLGYVRDGLGLGCTRSEDGKPISAGRPKREGKLGIIPPFLQLMFGHKSFVSSAGIE